MRLDQCADAPIRQLSIWLVECLQCRRTLAARRCDAPWVSRSEKVQLLIPAGNSHSLELIHEKTSLTDGEENGDDFENIPACLVSSVESKSDGVWAEEVSDR